MKNIQKTGNMSNEIKASMMRHGLNMRKWSNMRGFQYSLVYQVILGDCGKLESPKTISYQIQQALKADGFWPQDKAA